MWNSFFKKNMYVINEVFIYKLKDIEDSVFMFVSNDDGDFDDNVIYFWIL